MKAALIAVVVADSKNLGDGDESALAVIGLNDHGYQALQGVNNRVLELRAQIAYIIKL